MQVSIKDFKVKGLEIGNTGVEIDVYSPDGKTHHGDIVVTKASLIWCKGKTTKAKGKKISWDAFMKWAEMQP